ncbi:hypothetical protein EVAR_30428_1 [Eumeta japonica]|uniref:Uncharacterized protein n=1 Tax=Eumeta variegata TaxID=151549 RepID=A0A4C1W845_EUMVA|nr:hypothetical protein EVAR_30428_1 [Eumeta japonica]
MPLSSSASAAVLEKLEDARAHLVVDIASRRSGGRAHVFEAFEFLVKVLTFGGCTNNILQLITIIVSSHRSDRTHKTAPRAWYRETDHRLAAGPFPRPAARPATGHPIAVRIEETIRPTGIEVRGHRGGRTTNIISRLAAADPVTYRPPTNVSVTAEYNPSGVGCETKEAARYTGTVVKDYKQ